MSVEHYPKDRHVHDWLVQLDFEKRLDYLLRRELSHNNPNVK